MEPPKVNIETREERNWGELPMVQSQTKNTLNFVEVSTLPTLEDGAEVKIRARIHNCRAKGNLAFLTLRQQLETVQAVGFKSKETPKPMIKFMGKINNESIVDIYGTVKKLSKPIESCSIKNVEIGITHCYVVSSSKNVLPFQIEDAMNDENKPEEGKITVALATKLDNRVLDLRLPSNQAIFRIKAAICRFYRGYLDSQGFVEIQTPKLLGGTSEGGCEVFKTDYFGKKACLAQSPQLFKQMMIMGDFKKVYEVGPVFRAENSNTHRHLCEFIGLDGEMEIKEHYSEVLEVIGNVFTHIFKNLKEKMSKEIEVVKGHYGYEEFEFLEEPLILDWEEGIKLLKADGVEQSLNEDLTTATERRLGQLVKEKYKTDFYILHRYPEEARPFYTMLCKDDPKFTCSYDVFMRGQEIISGAQRIHDPEILKERAIAKGIEVHTIQEYIDSFSLGSFPHGGFGVGLERVAMLFLGLYDIRKVSLFPRDPLRLAP